MNELEYWERQPSDKPWLVNGFKGTWAFSDHDLIPSSLRNFICESFPKIERFKRIPLEDINALMNEVWEGPGSMVKISQICAQLREERLGRISKKGAKAYAPKFFEEQSEDFEDDEPEFEDDD